MKKSILSIAALLMLFGMLSTAQATTTLGTYVHNYGSGTGQVDPGGQDPLSDGYVTVYDTPTSTGYKRFNDSFSFSDLSYDSIESFKLTLNYGEVSSSSPYVEYWWVRPGGVVNTQGWSWGVYKTD